MGKFKKVVGGVLVSSMFLTACGSDDAATDTTTETSTEATTDTADDTADAEETSETSDLDPVDLRVNFAMGNTQRTLTYNQTDPLTMPDGEVITAGDLKPVWQYIGNELSINFNDVTIQDQAPDDMMQLEAATGFTNADIFGGNELIEDLGNYGAQGYFVDLNQYMDQLPNFSAYLEANGDIKSYITAYDGGIYYIPYIAEIGNYARIFMTRESVVEALLDMDTREETATIDIAYEGYWVDDNARNATNVISLQNEAAAANGGVLTQADAKQILVDYINDTYDYEKPSDLYLGSDAQYDMDEYVALLRLVKLSPDTFTELITGEVVEDALIQPFFVRQSKYREDLLRFMNYFGGQRVFGSDSYTARFYTDENGELQYSYADDNFIENTDYLKDMYAEGLISVEFSDLANKTNFRTEFYGKDDVEDHKQFGFATYDWITSTTVFSDDIVAMLPPLTTTAESDGEFIHFMENTRTVKPGGWAISTASSDEAIERSLALFDYFFTEEGATVQNYGVPSMVDDTEQFEGPDGNSYPKFNDWMLENATKFTSGDFSSFIRDFVGAQLPIGYQKQIGFEYQYTTDGGFAAWEIYLNSDTELVSYNQEDTLYKLAPPVFSLNDQELAKLGTTNVGEDQAEEIFKFIVDSDGAMTIEERKQDYVDAGIDTYLDVYRESYARITE